MPTAAEKAPLSEKLDESVAKCELYLPHLLHTKHQASYFQFVVSNLKLDKLVVIIHYKMKLEL